MMGNVTFSKKNKSSSKYGNGTDEINFLSFNIIRSIGKGSYGKVCIAQKKDTKELYAMKYMNKSVCIQEGAVKNILQELKLLKSIHHPNIVNLRFAFHDIEDMCLVVDLLQGGDLRYHLSKMSRFDEHDVIIYMLSIGSALEYLHIERIIHRDIKPENLLLDLDGQVRLTDFNIATRLEVGNLSSSVCGTWQYMAPEVFGVSCGKLNGYSCSIDWWSLGVTCFELAHGGRPFEVPTPASAAWKIFKECKLRFSSKLSPSFCSVLDKVLEVDSNARLQSCEMISSAVKVNVDDIRSGNVRPHFTPSMKKLNVDPAYELEELIIESKPIHKKEQRLTKASSIDIDADRSAPSSWNTQMDMIEREFSAFNIEKKCDDDCSNEKVLCSNGVYTASDLEIEISANDESS